VKLIFVEHSDNQLYEKVVDALSDSSQFAKLSMESESSIWAEQEINELPPNCPIENKFYCFLENDNNIVGISIFYKDYRLPKIESETVTISLLIIKEQFQNSGYGSKFYTMLEEALYTTFDARKVRLGVLINNNIGLSFWSKQGYISISTQNTHHIFEKKLQK